MNTRNAEQIADALKHIQSGHDYIERQQIGFYRLPAFLSTGMVRHGVSARKGGVSLNSCTSLNLSFNRPDDTRENVMRNYRLFADAAGIPWEAMVMDTFEHGVNVLAVTKADSGKGYLAPSLPFCDGLVTNDPAVALITGHADCLPLFFLDPIKRCIGLAHAGWKGTLHQIALRVINMMQQNYGSDPKNILAGVGPCICKNCFEVNAELGEAFATAFPEVYCVTPGKPGKAYVDLARVSAIQFLRAGIEPENISLMDVCTYENPDRLYSHRRDNGMTGGMAAYLQLLAPGQADEAFLSMPAPPTLA